MNNNSLLEWARNHNPDLIKEWDYESNNNKTPDDVTKGSNVKAWWICSICRGRYQATINHRTSGTGCPYCAGRKVLVGFNDLESLRPNLAKEWDYDKNGEITPNMITMSCRKMIWWICESCRGSYKSYVYNRAKGVGCPYCAGIRVLKGFNDLESKMPDLCKEWDYEKNEDLRPDNVTFSSQKRVWWICPTCHNSYNRTVYSRKNGGSCPYCSNKQVVAGFNDLMTTHPNIARDWDYEKNGELRPDMVSYGTIKKAWWICPQCRESYQASINKRSQGQGCPYCAGRNIRLGTNDLFSLRPNLVKEWDYEKNLEITPQMVTTGSNKLVWWKCLKCHGSYQAKIMNRSGGTGCPFCSGQKVLIGYNDLLSQKPDLCKEWDYNNNADLTPEMVTISSGKKVWWKCSDCHGSYQAVIYSRKQGTGCPICSGQRVLLGFNDLKSLHPELCEEWDFKKNKDLTPEMVTSGTNRKVWWQCSRCGHEWKTSISKRVGGTGCPNCGTRQTSFSEQAVYYYVRKFFPDATNRDISNSFELDIFIPSTKTAIEYDGAYFHQNDTKRGMKDDEKDRLCKDAGIRLIRIREKGLPPTSKANNILRKNETQTDLCECIATLLKLMGLEDFSYPDIELDSTFIQAQYTENYKKNSLAKQNPNLSKEWHSEKNSKLTPDQVTAGSDMKVWWKCSICGNEWQASIYNRSKGSGCPVCAAKKASERKKYDQNSFTELIADISPSIEIIGNYVNTSTKVACKCRQCGCEWEAWPSNLRKGTGCPKCKAKERGRAQAKSTVQFSKELYLLNKDIRVVGEYTTNATIIKCKCLKCGKFFYKTPSQLLQVPRCNICSR